jgi:hypothetical protein
MSKLGDDLPEVIEREAEVHTHYSVVSYATNGQVYGYVELICDTTEDLSYLPTSKAEIAVGSRVTVAETGAVYVLNNVRRWVQIGSNDGSEERPKDLGSVIK